MMTLTPEYMTILLLVLSGAVIVLFILCIVLFVKFHGQKKKYDFFMGANRRPTHNLEMKIEEYFETSKSIEEKYSKLLDMVTDMDKTDKSKIQKVGLIRYNPFDEMGGNLCFALALLDANDNGVVLNGIHSRTGSFTYAKPIEMGVSTYMLSEEEIKAVELAKNKAYVPEHEKVAKVRFKPTFRRKDKDAVEDQLLQRQQEAEQPAQPREKMTSIGDVTEEEKALILKEETMAGKIAAAEAILKKREEARLQAETAAGQKVETAETEEKETDAFAEEWAKDTTVDFKEKDTMETTEEAFLEEAEEMTEEAAAPMDAINISTKELAAELAATEPFQKEIEEEQEIVFMEPVFLEARFDEEEETEEKQAGE